MSLNKLEIITTEDFGKDYGYYGYNEFVKKVLQKCANKKKYGLTGKITLEDAEVSKRILFKNENGQEFTVRYFIQSCGEKEWRASYTLYMDVKDESGSHGEEISCGYAMSHYVYPTPEMEELRQKELIEQEEAEYKDEHLMICPKCQGTAINQAPNGAGELVKSEFYCLDCGWEE